jgi:uncharacterized membrane protein
MKNHSTFWLQWILNYSIGEVMGIAAAATIGRLMFIELSGNQSLHTSIFPLVILIIAGAAEGFIIGYAQWKSLSLLIANFKPGAWIITTTIAVTIGWLTVLPPSVVFISFLSSLNLINDYYSILYAGLAGLAFGGIISTTQFFIIRKFYRNAEAWIIANALGWMLSFMVIYIALSVFPDTKSFIYNVLIIITSCIVSGIIQGIITGTFLQLFMISKVSLKEMNGIISTTKS